MLGLGPLSSTPTSGGFLATGGDADAAGALVVASASLLAGAASAAPFTDAQLSFLLAYLQETLVIPTVGEIASAVRIELMPELSNMDAPVSGAVLTPAQDAKLMSLPTAPAISGVVWTAAERTLTSGGAGGISQEQYDALLAAINSRSTLGLTDVLAQQAGGSAVVTEILTADVQTNAPLTGG